MESSANKVVKDAVSCLIRDGLLEIQNCSWSDVLDWIDTHYHKSFFEGINYYEYINSDEWRKERERQFDIHGRACEICGTTHNLQVHHISYKNGMYPEDCDCAVLCRECHEKLHTTVDRAKQDVDSVELTKRKWMDEVNVFLGHKLAEHINEEWRNGIPGKRKVRTVLIIRDTLACQNNVAFNPHYQTMTHDLIKRRK